LRDHAAGGTVAEFRESEIEDLDRAIRSELDIRGLQIAMDNAPLVRRFERFGDLLRDWQHLIDGDRAARDPLGKVFALDQLHDQRRDAVGLFDPVDRRDVRMIQRREEFRFALKARQPVRIRRELRWEDFECDLAFQPAVGRAIHLAHAAGSERGDDLVRTQAGAEGERHEVWIIRSMASFAS
jgi:hypothetical protein